MANFATENLNHLSNVFESYVEGESLAGACVMIQSKGRIVFNRAFGCSDLEKREAMRTDTIFRGASITKAITCAATLILVERGLLMLTEPVASYIPEFSHLRVLSFDSETDEFTTVPCTNPMTIRHLMTHSSGLSYGLSPMLYPGDKIVLELSKLYRQHGVFDQPYESDHTSDELIRRLAQCPLACQPGEKCVYSLSHDILGIIISKITNMRFEDFVQVNIFDRLEMSSSFFQLPLSLMHRVAQLYRPIAGSSLESFKKVAAKATSPSPSPSFMSIEPVEDDEVQLAGPFIYHKWNFFTLPQVHKSGGGGMVTKIEDYGKFLASILASYYGVEALDKDSTRPRVPTILGRRSVHLMANNMSHGIPGCVLGPGWGFGCGFCALDDPYKAGTPMNAGSFKWGGVFGLDYFVDPVEDLVGIMFTQKYPNERFHARERWIQMVYGAVV